jgi:hypothetical protein
MEQKTVESDMLDPQRWGLPDEVVVDLGNRLRRFWSRFRTCFKTKTRDASEHAWTYLRGLLGMETERNSANMARRVTVLPFLTWDNSRWGWRGLLRLPAPDEGASGDQLYRELRLALVFGGLPTPPSRWSTTLLAKSQAGLSMLADAG